MFSFKIGIDTEESEDISEDIPAENLEFNLTNTFSLA